VDTRHFNFAAFALGMTPDGQSINYSTYYETFTDVYGCALGANLVMGGHAPNGTLPIGNPVRPYGGDFFDGFAASLRAGAVGSSDPEVTAQSAIARGGALTVSVAITNHGPDPATGVILRGSSPFDSQYIISGQVGNQFCADALGFFVTCDVGTIASGA